MVSRSNLKQSKEIFMAVGFSVSFYWYQVGTGDFLHSFFSTIACNLEARKWGSRYPVIMNDFYNGRLEKDKIEDAIVEIRDIQNELKGFSADCVVWDYDDCTKQPPWGNNISSDITDLSNYFVTSDGEDLITILIHALEKAKELEECIEIESM